MHAVTLTSKLILNNIINSSKLAITTPTIFNINQKKVLFFSLPNKIIIKSETWLADKQYTAYG